MGSWQFNPSYAARDAIPMNNDVINYELEGQGGHHKIEPLDTQGGDSNDNSQESSTKTGYKY